MAAFTPPAAAPLLWLQNPSAVELTADVEFHSFGIRGMSKLVGRIFGGRSSGVRLGAADGFARVELSAPRINRDRFLVRYRRVDAVHAGCDGGVRVDRCEARGDRGEDGEDTGRDGANAVRGDAARERRGGGLGV